MVFTDSVFLIAFFPALLLLYYQPFFTGRAFRNGLLLLFSLLFYAWEEPFFVFVMLFSIVLNWYLVLRMDRCEDRAAKKRWMIAAIFFDVLLIFTFKYLNSCSRFLHHYFRTPSLPGKVPLPVGISFFTFQLMSYVFDVYGGTTPAQKGLADTALYIALFPQLIAGPIVRFRDIQAEIRERQETLENVSAGMQRFLFGVGKKVLIADFLARIADAAFNRQGTLSAMTAWLGAFAYSLQIYYDFSAYSDMAIGLGRMFGFHFPENFRSPYRTDSFTGFWRRWHISLSSWFRDYVYIPLGGSRKGRLVQIRNLFIIWFLTGAWHGAHLNFVLWGMVWFCLLVFERAAAWCKAEREESGKIEKSGRKSIAGEVHADRGTGVQKSAGRSTGVQDSAGRGAGVLRRIVVLSCICLTWVLFRVENIREAFQYYGMMFGAGGTFADSFFMGVLKESALLLFIAVVGLTPLPEHLLEKTGRGRPWITAAGMLAVFGLSLAEAIVSSYSPFLYFNF